MKRVITLSILLSLIFTSCYVNRVTVGYGPVGETLHSRTYSKIKQRYLVFGLVRLNHVNPPTPPANVGYEIKSSFTFVDGLLTLITAGIYGQRSVKILVDKSVERDIKMEQQSQQNQKKSK
jgi:hypothetical protein